MQSVVRVSLLSVFLSVCFAMAVTAQAAGVCGDGVIDPNEECDPGGTLYVQGNPANPTCTSGGDCFFEMTCCKFNCQYANPGPCYDGNDCTVTDACDNVGNCLGGALAPEGQACDDGLYCTVDTTCDAGGACVGGTSPCTLDECVTLCDEDTQSCLVNEGGPCTDDGNACTDDVCDAGGACTHPGNSDPCDDGMYCNGTDTCSGGTCSVHSGDPCTGGGQCSDVCDEALDTCDLPNGTSCDDGLFCTETDTCSGGTCVGSGDPCASGGECDDVCNEVAGNCNVAAEVPCTDDGDGCTDDFCDGAGSCSHPAAVGLPCDDGLLCTVDDACDETAACVGVPKDCGDGDLCTYDACDEMTGDCIPSVLGPNPEDACRHAGIDNLSLVNKSNDRQDRLKWKWFRGDETDITAWGDPINTTTQEVCIFDELPPEECSPPQAECWALKLRMNIPPSALFIQQGNHYKYKDKTASADGAKVMKLFPGSQGRARMGIKGKGELLDMPAPYIADQQMFAQNPTVAIQFANTDGQCWQSRFDTSVKNSGTKFKTRRKVLVGGGSGG